MQSGRLGRSTSGGHRPDRRGAASSPSAGRACPPLPTPPLISILACIVFGADCDMTRVAAESFTPSPTERIPWPREKILTRRLVWDKLMICRSRHNQESSCSPLSLQAVAGLPVGVKPVGILPIWPDSCCTLVISLNAASYYGPRRTS
jgi:hypothetical protein